MLTNKKCVKAGVGIFVFNSTEDKFLLGKRLKEENQFYGLVGGKLEYLETFEQCAQRELLEETGIYVKDFSKFKTICSFNCINVQHNYHWTDIYITVKLDKDEETYLCNPEPDK